MFETPETTLTAAAVQLTFLPEGRTVEVEAGTSILQAARLAGVHIDAPCGERGRCGKCRVKILEGDAGKLTEEEQRLLKPEERDDGVRLSCMTRVHNSLSVMVPEGSRNLANRKATAVLQRNITPDSWTQKKVVQVARPSLVGADLRDDMTRLREALPNIADVDIMAVRELHNMLVNGEYSVTAVVAGNRLIAVESGDTSHAHYGVALDIGTTSMVGYLLDLNSGEEIAAHSLPNPQASYGGDLISRIEFSQGNKDRVEALRSSVTAGVNQILHAVSSSAKISPANIYQLMMVGNTCMSHLFLGIDPISLGHAPYTPVITESVCVTAAQLGIDIHPCGMVRTLPNIAGFVGADTVGVLAAGDMEARKGLFVAVDIGTNAEVLVSHDGQVIACSTAAGPAFEGAKISQGMRAQSGAIDGVTIGEDIFIHTIGDVPPIGICGSGIIDAIGELRRVDMLDSTGRFAEADDMPDLSPALSARLREDGVVLVWAAESGIGRDIILTKHDVREIQLVKGAIFAGIATLLDKRGHETEDIDGFMIAGAFGTYITKEHALGIGLIPNVPLDKLIFLGNAAGAGAKMALISQQEFHKIVAAAKRVGYVELAGDLTFSEHFMMAMTLAPGCEDWD